MEKLIAIKRCYGAGDGLSELREYLLLAASQELYTRLGFDLVFLKGPRMISCTGDRRPAREVLATRHL